VTDVGTQFELVAVDDALTITMREGTVNVALPQATGQPLVARAEGAVGDVVKIDGKFGVTKGSLATNDSAWDWTRTSTPPLPAGRYPLTDVIRWAARQSGRTVEYDQPITRLRAENEWVDWPEIPAVEIEQKLTELDDTTSDFLISFTRSEMVVTHR
jgi:ferric-dicitrate binding protein FerR (iron transport regulator)